MGPALTDERKEADEKFKDPKVREKVAEWHRQGMSFVDMLTQLGIPVSEELKKVLNDMPANEIATIRRVMLAAIEKGDATMPIDCGASVGPVPVTITEARGRIKVTPK